eukprot:8625933-Pyramimonas_sp.AAC.1
MAAEPYRCHLTDVAEWRGRKGRTGKKGERAGGEWGHRVNATCLKDVGSRRLREAMRGSTKPQ